MRMVSVMAMGLVLASGVCPTAAMPAAARGDQAPAQGAPPGAPGIQRPPPRTPVQRPPRDPRAVLAPVDGTGTVSGRVVDAATGQPVVRVRVRLMGRAPRSVLTDAQGVFAFDKVPMGPINLMTDKAAYVSATFPDSRRSMRRPSVFLAEGQKLEGVTVSMWRGSAISGRVVDPYGDPIEGVMLSAIRVPTSGRAGARPMTRGGQSANDIGEFRIGRLEPGSYYVLATPQPFNSFGPRGRGDDEEGPALGRTYYPGVASLEQAQPITLEKGQSVAGIELTLLETTLTRVTGMVVDRKGEAVSGGSINARLSSSSAGSMSWSQGGGQIQPDGTFELRLQAGEYLLDAMPRPRNEGAGNAPSGPQERDQGILKLAVSGESMSGVVITTGAGATASGRIVFEGEKPPPTNFAQGIGVSFGEPGDGMFGGGGGGSCRAMSGRPQIQADGTFVVDRLWGTCQVRANAQGGWQLKAVLHRGTDITTRAIDFQGGQHLSDLQVIFTDRVGELTFDVSDDGGTNVGEYVVLVFPVDKALWSDMRLVRSHVVSREREAMMASMGGGMVRMEMSSGIVAGSTFGMSNSTGSTTRVVTAPLPPGVAGPGSSGQALRGLLPGDYLAIALDDASFEDVRDPSFLGSIAPLATRISVSAGDTKSVTLRRATLPDAR